MPSGEIHCSGFSGQFGGFGFELTNIYATGGPDFPVLSIRADVKLLAYQQYGQNNDVQPLSLVTASVELRSPEHRIVAYSTQNLPLLATDPSHHVTGQHVLNFPLDLSALTKIESARNGGDLRVQLDFRLLMALHEPNPIGITFRDGNAQIIFTIPRSQWVDKLLPALGYQGLELIEVPSASSSFAQQFLAKAVQQVQNAKKELLEGRWEGAVLNCRQALELILDSRPPVGAPAQKFKDRVNDFIRDHLSLDPTQAALLASQIGLLWETCSKAAHASGGQFKRPDAEFIVHATIALTGFVGRSLS